MVAGRGGPGAGPLRRPGRGGPSRPAPRSLHRGPARPPVARYSRPRCRHGGSATAPRPRGSPPGTQLIRPPEQVLWAPRHATCLDLAVVLAGACINAGLHPAIVVRSARGRRGGWASVVLVRLDPDPAPRSDGSPRRGRLASAPAMSTTELQTASTGPTATCSRSTRWGSRAHWARPGSPDSTSPSRRRQRRSAPADRRQWRLAGGHRHALAGTGPSPGRAAGGRAAAPALPHPRHRRIPAAAVAGRVRPRAVPGPRRAHRAARLVPRDHRPAPPPASRRDHRRGRRRKTRLGAGVGRAAPRRRAGTRGTLPKNPAGVDWLAGPSSRRCW